MKPITLMSLPFTVDQFLEVFADYNRAVWPAQVILFGFGLLLATVAYLRRAGAVDWIALGLALLWGWMASVYHLGFFRSINPAALVFALLFGLQALLFASWRIIHGPGEVGRVRGPEGWVGGSILAYALVIYPLLGFTLGHRYPTSPTFGLPCPTTIATLGLMVWVTPRPPWWLWVIPLGWTLVGTSAALALGMIEDLGLLAAALAAVTWLWYRTRHAPLMAGAVA